MNANGNKTGGNARTDRKPESHGVRLQFILPVGAVVVLLGYIAFRPSKSSSESVSPPAPAVRSPQQLAVVVPKRHVGGPVVREAPVPDPTLNAIAAPTQPIVSAPSQSPAISAGSLA